ncbi:unnamed protein product [Mytilus edulis]|uniref:FLYWCH-type domain-containing protein n=1 Tax=Mytilus edulis TaxID=6550 RepID=A0A8S3TUW8_MYTED|nr:unnamed protein product [Mytilus edulis]
MNKIFEAMREMDMFSIFEPAILEDRLNFLFIIMEKTKATTDTEKHKYVRIALIECSSLKGCSASITTDPEGTAVVKTKNTHSHDRDEHKAETRQLRVRVRQNSGDISQRPSQVIRGELQKMDENLLNHQDLKNVAMSLYRERRKQFPKLPKSRLEIHETLRQMDLNTSKTESFTLVNDLDSGIVIFSCFTNLECLCNEMTDIFRDGTFKSCPKFCYQLYSIHG